MHKSHEFRRRRGRSNLVLAAATAATAATAAIAPVAALAADTWSISIGVRETGSSGAIGANGGTSGSIEWINLDGQTINADGLWHQYTWNFGTDPVQSFSGGNGILSAANNKGVLEHVRIVNSGGNSGGAINIRIDDIVNTAGGTPVTVAGFETSEGFTTMLTSSQPMFREPIFSATTIANMSTGLNSTTVSTIPHSGSQSMSARFSFVPNGSTTQWLRLSTNGATVKPNPIIDFTSGNTLTMWMRANVVNSSGDRAFGVDVSSNQGTGIDWNRVAQPMTAGGAGLTFAFARATRGGTSGTSTTGAMRVDDTTFTYNITNAKAAGLLTGPYHFGRPDMWTAGDSSGNGDAPGSIGTPEDEARHMLEMAGIYMKVGYMRPVYDLEDGAEEQNNAQMTSFVNRFANTLMKYKGPAAKMLVYAGSSYASQVNSSVSQYPLWMPRWPSDPNPWADDPFTSESSYGVWNDGDSSNPLPWSFWQYNSPDVYIPGIGGAAGITHNDIDVAHGDVNYVRQFLIQGAIWDGSSSAAWTTAANWDSNAEPTSTTELLFDAPVPGTGSTITLTSGRSASGIYFAHGYTLSGGSLSLSDGRIDVDASKTATISTSLSTPNGFRKVGLGTLTHSSGTSTVTGIAQVLQGTMNVSGGSIAISGNLMVNPELTQKDKSLVAPFPASASDITSGTLNINGAAVTAAAAYVGGTDTASGAIGTLNVSSGSLAVTGVLKIWNSSVPLVDSKVNFSGGALSAGSIDTDGDPASFNWTGGVLTLGGDNSSSAFNASGSGNASLVKTGTGVLTLNIVQAYTGPTSVSGGTLRLGVDNAVPSASAVTVTSPGTFDLNGFSDSIGSLTGNGNVALGAGTLTTGLNNVSITYSGAISGSGSLVKAGTGIFTLAGSSTYSGGTTINAGTLRVSADSQLGNASGGLSINDGATLATTATFSSSRGFVLGSTIGGQSTISPATGTKLTVTTPLTGAQVLNIGGAGTLELTAASTRPYSTVIPQGIVRLLDGAGLGEGQIAVNGGALELVGVAVGQALSLQSGTLRAEGTGTYTGTVTLLASPATVTLATDGNTTDLLTIGDAANDYTGGTSTHTTLVTGGGTVSLPFSNDYAGAWQLNGGTLRIGHASALGVGTGAVLVNNAKFELSGITFNRAITLNSGSTLRGTGTSSSNGTMSVTPGAAVTLASGPLGTDTLSIGNSTNDLTGGGSSSTINVSGGGRVRLLQASNYTGNWTVSSGVLEVVADNRLGNSANTVTLAGGTLRASGIITSSRSLAVTTTGTFDSNGLDSSFGNVSGNGTLTKTSAGMLTVNHVRTGGLAVSGGSLRIAGGLGNSGTSVLPTLPSVAGGASFDLNDTKMVVQFGTNASPLAETRAAVIAGRGGTDFGNAAWDGTGGISSFKASAAGGGDGVSFAVGYIENAFLPFLGISSYSSFGGQTVDEGSLLVRYTLGADATLDGKVNTDDVTVVGALYNTPGSGEWFLGDFDFDGICDSDDVTVLGAMYDATAPALSSGQLEAQYGSEFAAAFERGRALGSAVPEPAAMSLLLGGAGLSLLKRRRRRAAPITPA